MSNRDPLYGRSEGDSASNFDSYAAPDQNRWDDSSGGTSDQVKGKAEEVAGQASRKADQAMHQASEKADQAMHQASDKADEAKEKASEMAHKAHDAADQGMDQAASGLHTAADTLRQQGEERGGTVGDVATMAADRLEGASGYLREKDTSQMMDELEALVRRKPTESLLVAAGIGFVLSKVFR